MRILVVEDDPIIACATAAELEDAGHEVVGPACSSLEADALVAGALPDLALVDINLEYAGAGVGLARRLKSQGVACIFVSGQALEARRNCDAALGMLHKPFDMAVLSRAVPVCEAVHAGRAPSMPLPPGLELFAA
ncbi:MAG: response regulator [Phenylobacterium sp.]